MSELNSHSNIMDSANETSQQQNESTQGRTLQVDFSWKKTKALITDKDDPQSKPIYIVDYKTFKPNLVFKSVADDTNFASSTLHAISINADCEIRGQPVTLKALKRFKTAYTHLSYAFSNTDAPVPMTWTSTSDFKTWDFICLDVDQNPVAKFSANIWAVKKVGNIKFMASKSTLSDAMRDEIVVTGLTLYSCMVLRSNNILSLFGAIFSRPGANGTDTIAKETSDSKKAPGITT